MSESIFNGVTTFFVQKDTHDEEFAQMDQAAAISTILLHKVAISSINVLNTETNECFLVLHCCCILLFIYIYMLYITMRVIIQYIL